MSEQRGVPATSAEQAIAGLRPKRTLLQNVGSFLRRKPLGTFGAVVAVILILVAIFAPQIATQDQYKTSYTRVYAEAGTEGRLLGADHLGRDVFSRLIYGARISLYVGLVASLVGTTIGMMVAVASVHFGGITDLIVQRLVDGLMAFPGFILAVAIMLALGGASINNVIIALSIGFIPSTARIVRSQALSIKEMDYILAALAVGSGHWRIMIRHMVPNVMALYIIMLTLHLGGAIIAEASLSFLGVGAPPTEPSWGGMLSNATRDVYKSPMLAVYPGLAIAVIVFAWNLLGDALRDVLDPRLRGTS